SWFALRVGRFLCGRGVPARQTKQSCGGGCGCNVIGGPPRGHFHPAAARGSIPAGSHARQTGLHGGDTMTYPTTFLVLLAGLVAAGAALTKRATADAAKSEGEFARTTIDLGVVVSDVDKSAAFYKDAIGFKEVKGFSVSGDFCADAGLTNGKPLKIR